MQVFSCAPPESPSVGVGALRLRLHGVSVHLVLQSGLFIQPNPFEVWTST